MLQKIESLFRKRAPSQEKKEEPKLVPHWIKLHPDLKVQLQFQRGMGELSDNAILYQPTDLELAKIHLTMIMYKIGILNTLGHEDTSKVFGNNLDDGRIVVYYQKSASADIADAITLANCELAEKKLPLIPEYPTQEGKK